MKQNDFLKIGTNCRESGHRDIITEFGKFSIKSGYGIHFHSHFHYNQSYNLIKTDKLVFYTFFRTFQISFG